jgi:tRNA A37 methylthiotransferase MiaB
MTLETFFVIGGHCPRSKEDAQTIFNYFMTNGLKPVKKIHKADILCIYTCGGFNDTEKSSILTTQDILHKKSKNATVIVTGCLTKINPEALNDSKDVIVLDFDRIDQLDAIIHSKKPFKQIPNAGTIGRIPPLYTDQIIKSILYSRTDPDFIRNIPEYLNKIKKLYFKKIRELDATKIYHIRISRGCLGSCAYCSIKLAHGRLKSKSLEQIQKDFGIGVKKGYKLFKLIGQDIGCYGIDIKTNIIEVLKIFFNLPGNNKIILTDFHPQWFIKYYEQLEPLLIAHHKKILSLRIPIESGSDIILARMRRQYKIEEVKRYISRLKEKIPSLQIYTHIIVGFPGETDEDFQETLNLLQEIQFSSVGIYSYSDRSMTESFQMKEKISSEVLEGRMNRIKNQVHISSSDKNIVG